MKKLVILGIGIMVLGSVFAASRDAIVMAIDLINHQQSIVKQARSSAKDLITKIDWLKAQYADTDKKAEINDGLTELGVNGADLKTELGTIKSLMNNVLDNTTAPKSLR